MANVNNDLVDLLENLLVDAKAGNMSALLFVAEVKGCQNTNAGGWSIPAGADLRSLLGELHMVTRRFEDLIIKSASEIKPIPFTRENI